MSKIKDVKVHDNGDIELYFNPNEYDAIIPIPESLQPFFEERLKNGGPVFDQHSPIHLSFVVEIAENNEHFMVVALSGIFKADLYRLNHTDEQTRKLRSCLPTGSSYLVIERLGVGSYIQKFNANDKEAGFDVLTDEEREALNSVISSTFALAGA